MGCAVSMKEDTDMENRKKEKKQLLRAEGRAAYICSDPELF